MRGDNRNLLSYDASAGTWATVAAPMAPGNQAFSTDGVHHTRNNMDGHTIWLELYDQKTNTWSRIGDSISSGRHFNSYLMGWKYDAGILRTDFTSIERLEPGNKWTTLTTVQLDFRAVVMQADQLLARTLNGGLMLCASPRAPSPQWTTVSGDDPNVQSLAATARNVFVSGAAGTFQIPNPISGGRSLGARDPAKTRWLITVTTASGYFAGYSGTIHYTFMIDGTDVAGSIPTGSFVRGRTFWFEIDIDVNLKRLQQVSLWGDLGLYVDDDWTLAKLIFYNPSTGTYFDYTTETTIGDGSQFASNLGAPSATRIAHTYPAGFVRIYVWQWRLYNSVGEMDQAIGHVSLELVDDGTYISWWPEAAKDAVGLAAAIDFPANKLYAAMQPRAYADDLSGENNELPRTFVVGGFDIGKIRTWWTAFTADPNNKYSLLNQNCSTTVYQALKAGGALDRLSIASRLYYDNLPGPWTPWFMYQFIELLSTDAPTA
jgi:hypothetical protein